MFDALHLTQRFQLHVLYCCAREPNREWVVPITSAPHEVLPGFELTIFDRSIHINLSVYRVLDRINPDVVITTGFNPTHLIAFGWAKRHGAKHIPMTDGTLESELTLTPVHRLVRRFVFKRSHAFLAASNSGTGIYKTYGVPDGLLFKSCLAVEPAFSARPATSKDFDLMFCGRLEHVKRPDFVLDVAFSLSQRLGRRVSLLMVGSGSQETSLRNAAEQLRPHVQVVFAGYVQRPELPALYRKCRALLVPSSWEPWGLVVNEALACGLYVVATSHVGAARELLSDERIGCILALDKDTWAQRIGTYLNEVPPPRNHDPVTAVREYTFDNAAAGILAAVERAAAPRVVILQRRLPHYRVEFFERLRSLLRRNGVELEVMFGDPSPAELSKMDAGQMGWGTRLKTSYLGRMCFQPLVSDVLNADLVICPHEASYVLSYRVLLARRKAKVAFWGHGRDMKSRANPLAELLKRRAAARADWWFLYTDLTKTELMGVGVEERRITVVNNAVATSPTGGPRHRSTPTAVFIGSLYLEKRIPFLIEACDLVKKAVPGFSLHVIGAGPDENYVREAVAARPWIHFHGPLTGAEKATLLRQAQVLLCPGLVGLNIVDGFAAGLPMITTDDPNHSPEIAYLKRGVNGVMTASDVSAYSIAVSELLQDKEKLLAMQKEAERSSSEYSLENMVERFSDGILRCLRMR